MSDMEEDLRLRKEVWSTGTENHPSDRVVTLPDSGPRGMNLDTTTDLRCWILAGLVVSPGILTFTIGTTVEDGARFVSRPRLQLHIVCSFMTAFGTAH